MRLQILPFQFKYFGLLLALIFAGPTWLSAFMDGFHSLPEDTNASQHLSSFFKSNTAEILGYVGLMVYVLSQDRIKDEYLTKIKGDSLQIVFFGTLIFIIIRLILQGDWDMSATYLFEAQVFIFLILNKIRKVIILSK
ncbi:hypothetical protein [Fulvivirga sp.]|uniref:hypothetical protein n=1 Tax=Fulvivirga sp. TaxID=1931237 RepID=UPI0032EC297D